MISAFGVVHKAKKKPPYDIGPGAGMSSGGITGGAAGGYKRPKRPANPERVARLLKDMKAARIARKLKP